MKLHGELWKGRHYSSSCAVYPHLSYGQMHLSSAWHIGSRKGSMHEHSLWWVDWIAVKSLMSHMPVCRASQFLQRISSIFQAIYVLKNEENSSFAQTYLLVGVSPKQRNSESWEVLWSWYIGFWYSEKWSVIEHCKITALFCSSLIFSQAKYGQGNLFTLGCFSVPCFSPCQSASSFPTDSRAPWLWRLALASLCSLEGLCLSFTSQTSVTS